MKETIRNRWFHALLLMGWVIIGAGLRLAHLAAKPLWTDEFATLVFTLGQSFESVLLDQPISIETLLRPLHLNPQANAATVAARLLTEDVHPPLYFVVAHWWMRMFTASEGLASVEVARLLPALLGIVSIPATFGLGWLAFRSLPVSQIAAAMMAVSPFGIFLAQEARQYALAILWVIAALCCLVVAARWIDRHRPIPLWLSVVWICVNALGVATHYFFLLTLMAMAVALFMLGLAQVRKSWSLLLYPHWQRIYWVGLGTIASSLIWLPVWQHLRSHEVTHWIQSGDRLSLLALINPVCQAIAAWVTMLALLPVEADSLGVVIASGLGMVAFFLWAIPLLKRGLQMQRSPDSRLAVRMLGGFVLGAIAQFFLITYGLGSDLTRGARYNFVYFPAVIVLIGASLAAWWRLPMAQVTTPSSTLMSVEIGGASKRASLETLRNRISFRGRTAVGVVWLVGLLSGITVVSNLGYQKYYRPDLLVPLIQATDQPVLIATTQNTLVQIGEMMGIGWQLQQHQTQNSDPNVQFLLSPTDGNVCDRDCSATQSLHKTLNQMPRPLDLWLINFHAPADLAEQHCVADAQPQPVISGYEYQLYRCPTISGQLSEAE